MRFIQNAALIVAAYTFIGCGDKSNETSPEADKSNTVADKEVKEVMDAGKHLGHTMIQGQLNQCTSKSDILIKRLAEKTETQKEQEAKLTEMKKASTECKTHAEKLAKDLVAVEKELLGEDVYLFRETLKANLAEKQAKLAKVTGEIKALTDAKQVVTKTKSDLATQLAKAVENLSTQLKSLNPKAVEVQIEGEKMEQKKLIATQAVVAAEEKRARKLKEAFAAVTKEAANVAKEKDRAARVTSFENDFYKRGASMPVLSSSKK